MEICIKYGGEVHSHVVPVVELAVVRGLGGPHQINYPQFLHDAIVVASVDAAAQKVSDNDVRGALLTGCAEAIKAMQAHAGPDVLIRPSQPEESIRSGARPPGRDDPD